jgi:hypothetical protein
VAWGERKGREVCNASRKARLDFLSLSSSPPSPLPHLSASLVPTGAATNHETLGFAAARAAQAPGPPSLRLRGSTTERPAAAMTSLSRELVFLILQFLDEEKFKETVHK